MSIGYIIGMIFIMSLAVAIALGLCWLIIKGIMGIFLLTIQLVKLIIKDFAEVIE